jgi:molybdopterin-guanine dinucleotide biosynthesis protein A
MEVDTLTIEDEQVALVVNAGGQSLRMGRAKALLQVPGNGLPLIAHIIHRLLPQVSSRVIVVSNNHAVVEAVAGVADVQVVPDQWPDGGALGGLATGLAEAEGWAMVVACDMPFVEPAIFAKLIEVAKLQSGLDAIIPCVAGQAEPFHGLWHRRCLAALAVRLEARELKIQAALNALNVAWMDEQALGIRAEAMAFYNVNTPAEWEAVRKVLAKQEGPLANDC